MKPFDVIVHRLADGAVVATTILQATSEEEAIADGRRWWSETARQAGFIAALTPDAYEVVTRPYPYRVAVSEQA
jgi:hypothetical protein